MNLANVVLIASASMNVSPADAERVEQAKRAVAELGALSVEDCKRRTLQPVVARQGGWPHAAGGRPHAAVTEPKPRG